MIVITYKIGNIVKIIASNEWNGLYGVVTYKDDDFFNVFCTLKPAEAYVVTRDNIGDIELFQEK